MKRYLIFLLALIFSLPITAQQYGYKWRFGFSAGTTNYFGDIRPLGVNNFQQFTKLYNRYTHYAEDLSYQISAEYALGNSVGLMFTAGSYQFGSGDRFVQNNGTLYEEGMNFDRALNFQTNLYDAGFSFVFKPDNNWLLSGKSFFAPYLVLGIGYQTFAVYGDLLDANGNRYDYSDFSVIPDGTFETNLRETETEISGGYRKGTIYGHLGFGFRFRVTKGVEIFAQSDFKRAATDYLDDVSGVYRTSYDNDFQAYAAKPGTNVVDPASPYRGIENGKPDWYLYHGIGVKFSIGANKKSFNPPVVVPRYTYVPDELTKNQLAQSDSAADYKKQVSGVSNNYFTVIQLPSWEKQMSQNDSTTLNSEEMERLVFLRDSLENERRDVQLQVRESQTEISELDEVMAAARRDTSVSASTTQARLNGLENEKSIEMGKLTSLNSINSQLVFKIDSLNAVQSDASISYLDSAALTKELLIYPGQVSKILYAANGPTEVYLDSVSQMNSRSAASSETMTRDEFEEEMERFRSEMLQAQAKRDSAMIMAFASKIPDQQEYVQPEPQEIQINAEAMDEKTAKKLENNRKKQEKLEKKNNDLLKDALLVGGTVAATSAINNSGEKKEDAAQAQQDSLLRAQIKQDSLMIDSLQIALSNQEFLQDTMVSEKVVLLENSKVEIYFGINESTISESEKLKMNQLKGVLENNPSLIVELVGFADNTGSISYNLQLSRKRVESVKKFLVSLGVMESKIFTNEGGLILRGNSKGSMDQDRKVEVRIKESN